ncbi:unnamed protein product [Prorocentrum cordatum]|uniref:Uncharacterized protein n=1 Tax=Prorocentrum cordatum TaxID=2364126 RepID=A0ABN9TWB8_9DINO|nr:unnamed protein product [Polarella glacialis]
MPLSHRLSRSGRSVYAACTALRGQGGSNCRLAPRFQLKETVASRPSRRLQVAGRLPPVRAMRPWSLLRRAVVAAAVTTAAASRASGTRGGAPRCGPARHPQRHIHADLALGEEQRSSESEVLVTLREGGNPAEWRSVIMKYTSGQEVYSRVDKDGNRVVGFVQQLLASTPDVEELDVGLWGSRPKSDEESRT